MSCLLRPPPGSPSVQWSPWGSDWQHFFPHPLERYQVWGLGLHLSSSGQGKVTGVTRVTRNSCWKHIATSKCRPVDTCLYISGLLQIKIHPSLACRLSLKHFRVQRDGDSRVRSSPVWRGSTKVNSANTRPSCQAETSGRLTAVRSLSASAQGKRAHCCTFWESRVS